MPKPYKYLSLAVGYAKERDTAVVEVTDITFHPEMIREDREGKPCFAFWIIEYHIGRIAEVHRINANR